MSLQAEKRPLDTREDFEALLPHLARRKAASTVPHKEGESYLYMVPAGWQTETLLQDERICKVRSVLALENAFTDQDVNLIFIPRDASITATIARRVCNRHGAGKTVFFEVGHNE